MGNCSIGQAPKQRFSQMERRYLNIRELSEYTGISKATIYTWVCQKRIPYVKISNLLRFDLRQIDGWIKTRSVDEFKLTTP